MPLGNIVEGVELVVHLGSPHDDVDRFSGAKVNVVTLCFIVRWIIEEFSCTSFALER